MPDRRDGDPCSLLPAPRPPAVPESVLSLDRPSPVAWARAVTLAGGRAVFLPVPELFVAGRPGGFARDVPGGEPRRGRPLRRGRAGDGLLWGRGGRRQRDGCGTHDDSGREGRRTCCGLGCACWATDLLGWWPCLGSSSWQWCCSSVVCVCVLPDIACHAATRKTTAIDLYLH